MPHIMRDVFKELVFSKKKAIFFSESILSIKKIFF